MAKNCQHESITPDEILRDRIVLGILDDKMRERLLWLNDLTLQKTVNLIKATEQTEQQIKLIGGNPSGNANVNVQHLDRNVKDVEILTTINPFAAPISLLP